MPEKYYGDWLEVAHEEVLHFEMLNATLEKLGYTYGDFPVHDSLFQAMAKTSNILDRMAVVPRYLEASGLDSNQALIQKLQKIGGYEEVLGHLNIILRDEIDHVRKGDRWFKYVCDQNAIDYARYLDIITAYYPNALQANKPLNTEARLKAGFTLEELARFQHP